MKKLITNYTFDASAKTLIFGDYGSISLESVLLVTNVTDNVIIYNFADPAKGGSVATNVLTMDYDTTSMDDADDLQIYYDDPTATQAVSFSSLPAGTNNIGDVDIASLPNEGQQTMANSISVAVASDQTSVPTQLNANQTNVTGTITTSSSTVTATDLSGIGGLTVTIYGTYAGVNATFEVYDGVNWVAILAQPTNTVTPTLVSATGVLSSNSTNTWNIGPILGWTQFRVRATAYTSGTANVIIAHSAQFTQYLVNVGSMPAITGTVTANLGTGGTGATSLGKAEDAVHATGDVGVMALAVRQDSEASLVSASGDYSPLSVDSTGKLRSNVSGSVAHDAVDAGNPVKIGGKASSSAPADVATGDRVDAYFDLKGRLKVDGSDVTQPVSAASLPLPTGAATSANQTTANASLATLAGAVAGTEMQVDVLTLPALPAGNNNIGDVDIASSVLPTGASTSANQSTIIGHLDGVEGLLTTIDADTGVLAGTVASGRVQVDVISAPSTTVIATNLDIRDLAAASDSVSVHGDVGILDQVDLANANPLTVAIVDSNGDQITSFGASGGATEAKQDTQIARLDTIIGHVDGIEGSVDGIETLLGTIDADTGNISTKIDTLAGAVKAEDSAHVSGDTGMPMWAVRRDASGALAANDDYIPLTTDSQGNLRTMVAGGFINHDSADLGSPVKVGNRATNSLSALTLVADGDRTDAFAGVDGVQIVRPHSNLEDIVSGNASNTDGTSTQVIAASGAGVKTYITDITITNTSASNIIVELKDGTTTKWTFPVPANGGVTHAFTTPIPGTANTAWNFDPSAATTTVYCSAAGFKSKI